MPRHPAGAARARALAAARHLFYSRGVTAVTLDDVARTAGVSKNTIYAHFAGKEALAAAALDEQGEGMLSAIHAAMDAAGTDPAARIHAAFDALQLMATQPHFRGCPYLNAAAQTLDPAGAVHAQVHAHKDTVRDIFRAELINAAHPDPHAAADELLLLFDGALVHAATRNDTDPITTAHRLAQRLLTDMSQENVLVSDQ